MDSLVDMHAEESAGMNLGKTQQQRMIQGVTFIEIYFNIVQP